MQFREVLFQMRIVWSSEAESCTMSGLSSVTGAVSDTTHNPRHLMMELHGTDVVQMTVQSEEAASVCWSDVYKLLDGTCTVDDATTYPKP